MLYWLFGVFSCPFHGDYRYNPFPHSSRFCFYCDDMVSPSALTPVATVTASAARASTATMIIMAPTPIPPTRSAAVASASHKKIIPAAQRLDRAHVLMFGIPLPPFLLRLNPSRNLTLFLISLELDQLLLP